MYVVYNVCFFIRKIKLMKLLATKQAVYHKSIRPPSNLIFDFARGTRDMRLSRKEKTVCVCTGYYKLISGEGC